MATRGREGLEAAACEWYGVVPRRFDGLLGAAKAEVGSASAILQPCTIPLYEIVHLL